MTNTHNFNKFQTMIKTLLRIGGNHKIKYACSFLWIASILMQVWCRELWRLRRVAYQKTEYRSKKVWSGKQEARSREREV